MNDAEIVSKVAKQNGVSEDGVRTVLDALRSSGGAMAQFSHPDFGGMSQWSPGMTMVGDMFNTSLKDKLNAVCVALADYLKEQPAEAATSDAATGQDKAGSNKDWWPEALGRPNSVGSQGQLRYAAFGEARRLVVDDHGSVTVYDTGDHQISGVSQAQGSTQSLAFSSQKGVVRLAELPVVS